MSKHEGPARDADLEALQTQMPIKDDGRRDRASTLHPVIGWLSKGLIGNMTLLMSAVKEHGTIGAEWRDTLLELFKQASEQVKAMKVE